MTDQSRFGRDRKDRALTSQERADVRAALRLLQGTGLTVLDAVKRALEGRSALEPITVDDCADKFLHAKLSKRGATFEFYETKLAVMRRQFGERLMDGVTRAEFRQWIAELDVVEPTRAGYVRACRALWRWAAAQEPPLAGPSPTAGMKTVAGPGKTPDFLPLDLVPLLLEPSPWRPALALMLFGGVRIEEVAGKKKPPLTWRVVDVSDRSIRIPGECAKVTGHARMIQGLPHAIWSWLGTPGADSERICPGLSSGAIIWAKKRLKKAGHKWPKNALRHTFATYALALTGEPDRVSGWLGHEGSSRLLRSNYAGLARRAEAAAFFALVPPEMKRARVDLLRTLLAKPAPTSKPKKKARR